MLIEKSRLDGKVALVVGGGGEGIGGNTSLALAEVRPTYQVTSYVTGHNLVVDGGCTIKFSGMGPATK